MPPPPQIKPGAEVRLRQPSKPELASAEVDRTVGGAENQRRFDEPRRRQTLTSFPEVRIPVAPTAPLEYRPTVAAEAFTAPTLPARPEPTGIRIPEDETTPRSRVDGPPLSATPEQASNVALRARAEAAEAKAAELERRDRVRQETRQVSYPPARVERPGAPAPPLVSVPPDGSVESLRRALTKLVLGAAAVLALLGTPLAIWVSNIAAEAKSRAERATAQVAQASNEADAAKAKASTNAKDAAATERDFRQFRSNFRELMRLQGVEIPKTDGDPEPADLKPYAPLCPQGRVCTGPQLILTRSL